MVAISEATLARPLIVIEGQDGCGKNTQSHLLMEYLREEGHQVAYFDFPHYDSLTGRALQSHLQSHWGAQVLDVNGQAKGKSPHDELVLQCLMTVNRYEMLPVLQKLLKTSIVVCDRYWPSGYAYGAANGLDRQFLLDIHKSLPEPDLCCLLDIPVEESWKRRPERRDRYEANAELQQSVRQHYHALFTAKEWPIVDGLGTLPRVQTRLRALVTRMMDF